MLDRGGQQRESSDPGDLVASSETLKGWQACVVLGYLQYMKKKIDVRETLPTTEYDWGA